MKLDRRSFLMGSSAALAAFSLPALSQEKRMRLLWWGSQARADRTLAVADLYAKANPGYAFDTEFLSFNDYWPKLGTQVAGGNAPDVIQMDYRYIVEYATRGAIAPLDDFLGSDLNIGDFDEATVNGGKVDGKLYGVSLGANSSALIINTGVYDELGLPLPDQSTTYEDFARITAEISKAKIRDGIYGAADGSKVEPMFENWLRQRGKALYSADGQISFAADDVSEWFDMWAKMREAGSIPTAEIQALDQNNIETSLIVLGKSAMAYGHSNQLVGYQAVIKDKVTINNYPRAGAEGKGGHYRKPSQFWSVGATSANQQDAAKFISFFVNDGEAAKILGVERGVPESAAVRAALTPTLDELGQKAVTYVADLGDLAGALPPPPPTAAGEVDVALQNLAGEVSFGMVSPSDAGPLFVQQATDILARAKKG